MYEYEQDLREVGRLRNVIGEFRDDVRTMIRYRDRGAEVRPGRIKKLCYHAMRGLSQTYITGIAAEARRLGEILSPDDLEEAQEILDDIDEIVNEFAEEELDEESDEDCYYDYM